MKRIIKLCFVCLLLFCLLPNKFQIDAKKKINTNEFINIEKTSGSCLYGNKIYYSVLNKIYCVNKNGSGHKLVISEKNVDTFSSLNVHKGYIYCIADFAYGPGVSNEKLIKIKLDGSELDVLDVATKAMVVNNTIYYNKGKHIEEDGDAYTANIGIYSMKLNGRKRKALIKSDNVSLLGCIGKKLYYTTDYSKLYEADLNTSEASRRYITDDNVIAISGDYVYKKLYNDTSVDIYRVNIYSGVDEKFTTLSESSGDVTFSNNYMYYTSDYGRKINKMNLNTKKVKCIKKTGTYYLNDVYEDFLICTKSLESFEPSKPNSQKVLIKTNGKIIKKMAKYFVS